MKSRQHTAATLLACIFGASLALASCGGSDLINPGGGGTGSQVTTTAIGPISGFGSVIINGVRYDDSAASLSNEVGSSLSSSDLRLGMMVQVRGSSDASAGTGVANSITVFSEIKGIIDAVAADSVVVSGLTVSLVPTTVYDDTSTLLVGDFVEAYGVFDPATNTVIATRIERKSPDDFKLRGLVSGWDSTARQFMLGNTLVSYNDGGSLPAGFDNGSSVRAYALSGPSGGIWPVTDIRLARFSGAGEGDRIEIEGVVSSFSSDAEFALNGQIVDASGATFVDGSATDLAAGRWLEVEGSLQNGRLIAERVEFEDGSGSSSSGDDGEFEVTGQISNYLSVSSFTVRNTQIDASQAARFDDGSAGDLADGRCVEIKGSLVAASAGTILRATRVKFEQDCND